jgi:hypothetical protein
MHPLGIIVHHSACSSINGKGYDWMISNDGSVIRAPERTDPQYLHVCLEGNYNRLSDYSSLVEKEQRFIGSKLIYRLLQVYQLAPKDIIPHDTHCPGFHFPWSELVISSQDGYH